MGGEGREGKGREEEMGEEMGEEEEKGRKEEEGGGSMCKALYSGTSI